MEAGLLFSSAVRYNQCKLTYLPCLEFLRAWSSTALLKASELEDGLEEAFVTGFGEEELLKLNELLKEYEGTHKFHNFTVKVAATDSCSQRYILSFQSPGVFYINVRGLSLLTQSCWPWKAKPDATAFQNSRLLVCCISEAFDMIFCQPVCLLSCIPRDIAFSRSFKPRLGNMVSIRQIF